ncbi:MAG: DUF4922 domain-containing protein [Candidatus Limnocylindrales bacterium]
MPAPAEPLAAVLDAVWRDQGRIGFLLPASDEIEIREVEDPVSAVPFRFRWLPHRELRGNVAELEARGILSTDRGDAELFRDPRDPPGRFCFLCAQNIRVSNPKEQLVPLRLAGGDYYAGANFAWIAQGHFTVMAAEHRDQEFSDDTLAAMIELHAQADGEYRVIYNAPHGGATIPWHLHLQTSREPLPVEALPVGYEDRYPTTLRRFTDGLGPALDFAAQWRRRDPAHHRVNVLVAGPTAAPTIHIFPRDTRRSHAAAKGLMGGFEVCGDFVYSEPDQRTAFEAASAELARSILEEIRPARAR